MNERIRQLAEQATTKISFRLDPNTYKHIDDPNGDLERFEFDKEKFAELIVRECMKESMAEIIDDEDLATETDPLIREYLLGCNQGIVDAVVRFRNHFGVEE